MPISFHGDCTKVEQLNYVGCYLLGFGWIHQTNFALTWARFDCEANLLTGFSFGSASFDLYTDTYPLEKQQCYDTIYILKSSITRDIILKNKQTNKHNKKPFESRIMATCKAVAHLRDFAQVTYNYQQNPLGNYCCFCRSCLQWNKQTSALYIILSKTNKVLLPPYNDVIVTYIRIILCDFLWIFPLCRSTMA